MKAFIKKSIFGNNRDPCLLLKTIMHNICFSWNDAVFQSHFCAWELCSPSQPKLWSPWRRWKITPAPQRNSGRRWCLRWKIFSERNWSRSPGVILKQLCAMWCSAFPCSKPREWWWNWKTFVTPSWYLGWSRWYFMRRCFTINSGLLISSPMTCPGWVSPWTTGRITITSLSSEIL